MNMEKTTDVIFQSFLKTSDRLLSEVLWFSNFANGQILIC